MKKPTAHTVVENINDYIINAFEEEKKNAERLINSGRYAVVVLLSLAFTLRFYAGDIQTGFIPIYSFIAGINITYALLVHFLLNNNIYPSYFGYLTIMIDLLLVTLINLSVSFYASEYQGSLYQPYVGLYYIICYSCTLRFEYRFSITCALISGCFIVFSLYFDMIYHGILFDFFALIFALVSLAMVVVMSMLFTKGYRQKIFSSFSILKKHTDEIDSILKISRNISSRGELIRTLNNIINEAKVLLQSDFIWVTLKDDARDSMKHLQIDGSENGDWNEQKSVIFEEIASLIRHRETPVVFNKSTDFESIRSGETLSYLQKHKIVSIMGTVVTVDGTAVGTIITGKNEYNAYTFNDRALLGILSEQVNVLIKNTRLFEELLNENTWMEPKLRNSVHFEGIIGESPEMQKVFFLIKKASSTTIPILVRGESGTGKELVADALHNLSDRKDGPFIKINCAAIPNNLMETELFGYEKGAFTGADKQKKGKLELINGGTLLLDEIGDMNLDLQTKLLRVLQENIFERIGGKTPIKVDFRLISATNQNLEERIEQGKFRKDLYYRINGLPIFLPPLRDRKEDIPFFVKFFVRKYSQQGKKEIEFTRSAMKYLIRKMWDGNVRELENLVYRMITILDKPKITADDISQIETTENNRPFQRLGNTPTPELNQYVLEKIEQGCSISAEIAEVENRFIQQALEISGGSILKASQLLGIKKTTLYYKINKYDTKKRA